MSRRPRITAFPAVPLWPARNSGQWLQTFASTHDSGRAAAYWAFRSLGLPQGTTAWIPSYHCGVEADAAVAAGFDVQFYKLGGDLSIDEADLSCRLKGSPGAVLAIHYFGFPQPGIRRIARICAENQSILIEDCAHSLFSNDEDGRELGTFSPLAIYSLRKTLPVVDGGAIRCAGGLRVQPSIRSFSIDPYRIHVKTAARRALGEEFAMRYRALRWRHDAQTAHPSEVPQGKETYRNPFSALSRAIAAAADPVAVVQTRRCHFELLHSLLRVDSRYRPVWDRLPSGTCPLFLPVWVKHRSQLMDELATRGVETFRFGASSPFQLDPDAFPELERLRDNILCLPIHQAVLPDDIEYLASTFLDVLRSAPVSTLVE